MAATGNELISLKQLAMLSGAKMKHSTVQYSSPNILYRATIKAGSFVRSNSLGTRPLENDRISGDVIPNSGIPNERIISVKVAIQDEQLDKVDIPNNLSVVGDIYDNVISFLIFNPTDSDFTRPLVVPLTVTLSIYWI